MRRRAELTIALSQLLSACSLPQELSHINPWLHHVFHGNRHAKVGLFAIAMIMLGHITEHFHQVSKTFD